MLDIKVLYDRMEASTSDEDRMHIFFDIATFFLNTNEQRLLETADEIKALAEKLDSNLGRCFYHSTLGRWQYRKTMYQESVKEFLRALDLILLTDDLLMRAICYDSLGMAWNALDKKAQALEAAYEALAIYQQIPTQASRWQMMMCYNNIGVANKEMDQLDQAEANFKKGLEMEAVEPNERMRYNLTSNMGDVKLKQGKHDEAIAYFVDALGGFKKLNHKIGEVHTTVYMAHCHLAKGEYAIALQHYITAVKLLKLTDNKPVEIQASMGMGNVYMEMKAHAEALKHFQKALDTATAIADYKAVCKAYLSIGQAYGAMEMPEQAANARETGIKIATEKELDHELAELEKHKPAIGHKLMS